MSAIEPGTPVRVVIEAKMIESNEYGFAVDTGPTIEYFSHQNEAVEVFPAEADRPTLEQVFALHKPVVSHSAEMSSGCICEDRWTPGERSWFDHIAERLHAAGLIR